MKAIFSYGNMNDVLFLRELRIWIKGLHCIRIMSQFSYHRDGQEYLCKCHMFGIL